ncbi:MAG: hypothetical protein F6K17_01765 [Okeania sp. SIO3C4]|nr:hypothetical protein [Okeania sp. SIO3C4]
MNPIRAIAKATLRPQLQPVNISDKLLVPLENQISGDLTNTEDIALDPPELLVDPIFPHLFREKRRTDGN